MSITCYAVFTLCLTVLSLGASESKSMSQNPWREVLPAQMLPAIKRARALSEPSIQSLALAKQQFKRELVREITLQQARDFCENEDKNSEKIRRSQSYPAGLTSYSERTPGEKIACDTIASNHVTPDKQKIAQGRAKVKVLALTEPELVAQLNWITYNAAFPAQMPLVSPLNAQAVKSPLSSIHETPDADPLS